MARPSTIAPLRASDVTFASVSILVEFRIYKGDSAGLELSRVVSIPTLARADGVRLFSKASALATEIT